MHNGGLFNQFKQRSSFRVRLRGLMIGSLFTALIIIGCAMFGRYLPAPDTVLQPFHTPHSTVPTQTPKPVDLQLTPELITQLLDRLDQAQRQKDPDGILRHVSDDATITIHMLYGTQQQTLTLSRAEYRTSLNKGFAFPTANDYTSVNTTIHVAPDAKTAKASFKSTETLNHDRPKLQIEGEQSLVVGIRNGRLMILAIDEFVPGDFT